jgi:hypothetical protein
VLVSLPFVCLFLVFSVLKLPVFVFSHCMYLIFGDKVGAMSSFQITSFGRVKVKQQKKYMIV